MGVRAVIFDVGGVVLDSPFQAIAEYERHHELPRGFIGRVVDRTGDRGAWARLERGELRLETFYEAFERECAQAGHPISAREVMARIDHIARPRPAYLGAIRRIRDQGLRAAALTNNWLGEGMGMDALRPHFDVFVESARVGLRKPDPRIYQLACRELEVEPRAAIFLDDMGRNCKAARELGMRTIRVAEPGAALRELEAALGFPLLDALEEPQLAKP